MDALGTLLDEQQRPQEAVHWYKRSVAAGNAASAWNLAMHYIPLVNKRWYQHWMKRAAAMGNEDAIIEAAKINADPDYMTRLPLEDFE